MSYRKALVTFNDNRPNARKERLKYIPIEPIEIILFHETWLYGHVNQQLHWLDGLPYLLRVNRDFEIVMLGKEVSEDEVLQSIDSDK